MVDPRIERLAGLLVERCIDVQPGWQVLIRSTPLARPLLEEVARLIAQRGAYPLLRLGFSSLWPVDGVFAAEAPAETLAELPRVDALTIEQMDARITIDAPENTRAGADLAQDRRALVSKASRPFFRRSSECGFRSGRRMIRRR